MAPKEDVAAKTTLFTVLPQRRRGFKNGPFKGNDITGILRVRAPLGFPGIMIL
jgi:hypothetical protein